jgi:hypothetical protein
MTYREDPTAEECEAAGRAAHRAGHRFLSPDYGKEALRARWRLGWKKECAAAGLRPPADSQSDVIARIARDALGIKTLERQWSDQLDFHEVAVWSVERALQAAFDAGVQSVKRHAP